MAATAQLPPAVAEFLAGVASRQLTPVSSTYDQLMSRARNAQRRRMLAVALLLASPWLVKFIRQRLAKTQIYRAHRRRNESFTKHLLLASKANVKSQQQPQAPGQQVRGGAAGSKAKVAVDAEFIRKLRLILKIAIPGWRTKEMSMLLMHTFFLVARTYLSVVVARLDGRIVKDLIAANGFEFTKGLGFWFAIAVPATYTNSMIRYLQSKLAIAFRTRLTKNIHETYLNDNVYYRMLNLDSRIDGPDQLICTDIAKFCDSLAALYSNLAKPLLDMIIFNYQLTKSIGGTGMVGIFGMYLLTAGILRRVTPGFGKLAAVEAKLEGDFRGAHSRIITNAEEIAFYNGGEREHTLLETTYRTLIRHVNRIYRIRIFYNMFEDFVIKYSWSAMGLLVCSVPVFFPSWAGARSTEGNVELVSPAFSDAVSRVPTASSAHGSRTQGFITNKRLMISLADAGGRIMYSYKEMAELAGFTERVHELLAVFADMKQGKYCKAMVGPAAVYTNSIPEEDEQQTSGLHLQEFSLSDIQGTIKCDGVHLISMTKVPVVTPSGDALVRDLTFETAAGQHLLITGPNGVGKSAIMRIISGLWPVFRGVVKRPIDEELFFIPQRPYLSLGTLRDQVIYPHSHTDMMAAGRTDDELMEILHKVHLEYLPEREGGWQVTKGWKDVFSGGEKQRMNLARLFYHKPKFAMLDECTSAVSADVEGLMYTRAKDLGITLVTISHRPSLFKHHKYLLRLTGEGGRWELSQLNPKQAQMTVGGEIKDLQAKLREETKLRERLVEINQQLGVKVNAIKK